MGSDAGLVPVPGDKIQPFEEARTHGPLRQGRCRGPTRVEGATDGALLCRDGARGWRWPSQPGSAKANRKASGEQPTVFTQALGRLFIVVVLRSVLGFFNIFLLGAVSFRPELGAQHGGSLRLM